MSSRSRDEQECAQASSYDGQVFDNLAPQMTRHRALPRGEDWKTIILRWEKAVFPSPSNSKVGLMAHKTLKAHATPPPKLSKRTLS